MSLTLRKPSRAPLATVEAFINREDDTVAQTAVQLAPQTPPVAQIVDAQQNASDLGSDVIVFRRASRAMARRRTKPDRRRVTVYLDLDVASELAAYVSKADTEMSGVVSAALRVWLSKQHP